MVPLMLYLRLQAVPALIYYKKTYGFNQATVADLDFIVMLVRNGVLWYMNIENNENWRKFD